MIQQPNEEETAYQHCRYTSGLSLVLQKVLLEVAGMIVIAAKKIELVKNKHAEFLKDILERRKSFQRITDHNGIVRCLPAAKMASVSFGRMI